MADPVPDDLRALAVALAEEAGALLLEGQPKVRASVETKSTGTDMVTEMDRASERLIVDGLLAARPDDGILGEEGSARAGTSGVRWVIDPLDGTTNYLYGFPSYGVAIGAEVDGAPVAAAVHDPVHGETFSASLGGGSACNGRALTVTGPPTLATALVGTGFAYDAARRAAQAEVVRRVVPNVRDLRRAGAAALDLCWVAAGRLDAFYERGLAPWDWCAASLVAAEAGLRTQVFDEGGHDLHVAAPPHLFDDLVALLRDR
ncbi:MAG TPA: inositol monophosphatase family protein [Acidimicrobiales bacterium]|nr:inositol monophosphatase family protein [Acidimicrobiales bacterium]